MLTVFIIAFALICIGFVLWAIGFGIDLIFDPGWIWLEYFWKICGFATIILCCLLIFILIGVGLFTTITFC